MIGETKGRKVFNIVNVVLLILLACVTTFPFINVIAASFSTSLELLERPFMLFPYKPTVVSYKYIFSTGTFIRSMGISAHVTVVGTLLCIIMTFIMAYPLSHKSLVGRSVLMNLIVFTMLFNAGMIPTFLNIKQLGLMDSLWAIILPGAISTYNLIIVKNFMQQIPEELKEAARIDGANELYILWRIILPLSLPVLATFSLFYAVGHWNQYFNYLLYINDHRKWNVQILLRQIVTQAAGIGDSEATRGETAIVIPESGVKNACILVSTLPILIVYPFLQKYFTKGVLLGSIKG
ncbi:MAG: carbohydrate ABC transporter permease [Christensenellales bacterium]|jgi:putative aldouronate transport system permease protein